MKIVSESTEDWTEHLSPEERELPTMDIYIAPPHTKWLNPEEEREATATLFASLLDGGYGA